MTRIQLFLSQIGRVVFLRCPGAPPTRAEVYGAAAAWLPGHAAAPLLQRMWAWEVRACPTEVRVLRRGEIPGVDEVVTDLAGAEEVALFRLATHAVSVAGLCDATGEGWLGVNAVARAVARAFDGVVVDHVTRAFRPLDERNAPLAEVTLSEVSGTLSLPQGPNRWLFLTHGLRNLGVPEVWFDEVPAPRVATAITVLQSLRQQLAERAAAVRRDGRDLLELHSLHVPGVGPVALEHAPHPLLTDVEALRAHALGHGDVALGRMLSRRSRRVRAS